MSKKIHFNIDFSQSEGDKQIFYSDYRIIADIPENLNEDLSVHTESCFKGNVKELKNTFQTIAKYIYSIIKDNESSETPEFYESIQEKIENLMKSQKSGVFPTGA